MPGQADGAGDAGGGTERLEETLRVGAVGLCGAQPSLAQLRSAQPSLGSARGSSRGSASALAAWLGLVLVSSQC